MTFALIGPPTFAPGFQNDSMDFSRIPSPCFVLDEALLRRNLELIHGVQQAAGVQIILAFKGFAMWSAFPLVRQYLSGATASSLNEARLCYEEMKTKAHTYAVAYVPHEFGRILKYSSHITFNSLSQYRRFRRRLERHSEPISAGLRVNPEWSPVGTALYNPASPGSRLGEVAENLKEGLPEGIEGLHFHTLCESTSYDLEKTLEHFEARFGHFFPQLKWVNFGGGHLMTRAGYDVEHLIRVLKGFKARYPHLHVILEPGSAIAWDTGVLVATVLDIVKNKGVKTAILDVSFTAHMPDTLEMPYRPRVRGANAEPLPTDQYRYRLGGVSCLSGDFMEEYSFETPLRIGQRIVFEDMIHYTMVKTTTFNGVTHPSIAIWREEGRLDVVRRFGYRDYKNRLS
ncbi:MAG: carboxynorspermidine decarboxylase [Saprospiraceae bacterium]|nr:carboxynorspermidine decarboxylase [Saprospiraceae bacterium]MDW8230313.1 carboxynorspermidine decarboxylase [Saprospiraceae bacterium]